MTFWSGQLFKTETTAQPVRPGLKVSVPFCGSVSIEESWISQLAWTIIIASAAVVAAYIIIEGILFNKTGAIWTYIDWFILVSHLLLISTVSPANLSNFVDPLLRLSALRVHN